MAKPNPLGAEKLKFMCPQVVAKPFLMYSASLYLSTIFVPTFLHLIFA
jgi:hypothetical protein